MLLIPGAMGLYTRVKKWYNDSTFREVIKKAISWGVDVVLAAFFLLGDTRVMASVALCILGVGQLFRRVFIPRPALPRPFLSIWNALDRVVVSAAFVLTAAVMLVVKGELSAFRASIVLLCAVLGTVGAVVADTDVGLSEQGKAFAVVVLVVPFVFAVSGTGEGAWGTPYWPLAGPLLCVAVNIATMDATLQDTLYVMVVACMVVPFAWSPASLPPLVCSGGKTVVAGACVCPTGMAFNETYEVCTNGTAATDNCGNALFADAARFMGGGNACLCNSPHGEFIREFSGCKCAPGWSGILCTHVNVSNATQ